MVQKEVEECVFLFIGNEDVVGHMIPRAKTADLLICGIHFFPHENEVTDNPYPDIFTDATFFNPPFATKVKKSVDIIVFNQNVEDVATCLNHFLTIQSFFDGKGFIFVCKDAESLMWKAIHQILVTNNIIHLIIYVPQEEKKEWDSEIFIAAKCYVSGDKDFFTHCQLFLTSTVASPKNLKYIGSGIHLIILSQTVLSFLKSAYFIVCNLCTLS